MPTPSELSNEGSEFNQPDDEIITQASSDEEEFLREDNTSGKKESVSTSPKKNDFQNREQENRKIFGCTPEADINPNSKLRALLYGTFKKTREHWTKDANNYNKIITESLSELWLNPEHDNNTKKNKQRNSDDPVNRNRGDSAKETALQAAPSSPYIDQKSPFIKPSDLLYVIYKTASLKKFAAVYTIINNNPIFKELLKNPAYFTKIKMAFEKVESSAFTEKFFEYLFNLEELRIFSNNLNDKDKKQFYKIFEKFFLSSLLSPDTNQKIEKLIKTVYPEFEAPKKAHDTVKKEPSRKKRKSENKSLLTSSNVLNNESFSDIVQPGGTLDVLNQSSFSAIQQPARTFSLPLAFLPTLSTEMLGVMIASGYFPYFIPPATTAFLPPLSGILPNMNFPFLASAYSFFPPVAQNPGFFSGNSLTSSQQMHSFSQQVVTTNTNKPPTPSPN